MRNLKRVLSLAMASVMLLGMMVIGAGAVDYKDDKDISYEEAAAVMSAIGVFQGDNNGYFNPKGDLTREAAAKIITYMLMGKDAADGLATSKAPFTDVAANRWSAGSIAYCVQNGIVAGDGQGNFFPEATVTGSQFGKMLLGALGYQAEAEGLVGNGWEINVAKLVKSAGLNKDLSAALSRTMTREQAAQMAFNTLNARLVEYQGGTKVTTPDGTVVNVGGVRTFIVNATGNIPYRLFRQDNFVNLTPRDVTSGTFNRPAVEWKNGAKVVGTFDSKPTVVYTAEIDKKDVKSDLGGYDYKGGSVNVTKNSVATLAHTAVVKTDDIADITADGRIVEIYADATHVNNVVVIDTYITTISTVSTVNKEVRLKNVADAITEKNDEDLYDALVDMGKDAHVLYNVNSAGKVLAVAEPEVIVGSYTAANKDKNEITVGGDKYTLAVNSTPANSSTLKLGTTYELYLDANGYVVLAQEEEAAATTLGFVTAVDRDGSYKDGYTLVARVVLADGTQKWIDVSSIDGTKVTDDTLVSAIPNNSAIAYSEKSDGTYSITKIVAAGGAGTVPTGGAAPSVDTSYTFASGAAIQKEKVDFITGNAVVQGNSKTIFLVKSGSTYKAYTGVKNVPNMTGVEGIVVLAKNSHVATLVVVTKSTSATTSDSYGYITRYLGAERVGSTDLYLYEAVVKGEIVTLKKTGSALTGNFEGLYKVDYDADGYASSLSAKIVANVSGIVDIDVAAKVENGVIKLYNNSNFAGASKNLMSADDFKVVLVTKDNKAVEINAADAGDYTQKNAIAISKDGFVTALIVVETNTPVLSSAKVLNDDATATISTANATAAVAVTEASKTVAVTVSLGATPLADGATITVIPGTVSAGATASGNVTLTYTLATTTWSTGTITVTAQDGSTQAYAVSAS